MWKWSSIRGSFQMPQGRSPCLFQKCELHHVQSKVRCFLLQRGCHSCKCTDYLFRPFDVSINFSSSYVTSSLTLLTSTCVSLSQSEMWRSQSSSRCTQGIWESARGNISGRRPVERSGSITGKVEFTLTGRHELELLGRMERCRNRWNIPNELGWDQWHSEEPTCAPEAHSKQKSTKTFDK